MNSQLAESHTWRSWNLSDWNAALFHHVFSATGGDAAPVSRIVLTDDEFGKVVGDLDQPPGVVLEAFRVAVLDRLRRRGVTLLRDARGIWYDRDREIPPFFGHLVVTCIASTWDEDPTQPDGEFRKRLNRFLGRGDEVKSYWLNDLPSLWEELRNWLASAIDSGQQYRPLILSRRSHLKIIGYSEQLAFPSLHDLADLADLFGRLQLPSPPPVLEVVTAVRRRLHLFGHRFQLSFEEFEDAVRERDPLRYRLPFWSVVLQALRLAVERATSGTRTPPNVELALELGQDGWCKVVPFLDSLPQVLPVPPLVLVEDEFGAVELFPFVLETSSPNQAGDTIGDLVLSGRLSQMVPDASTRDVDLIVGQGVLLFTRSENQTWVLVRSRPSHGAVRALVRDDLRQDFDQDVRMRGGKPTVLPSGYTNWVHVENFSADELPLSEEWAQAVRCLDETITPPRISLHGGVILPNGWLGLRPCLPRVSAEGDEVTIAPASPQRGTHAQETRLEATEDTDTYSIPGSPSLAGDLSGRFVFRARVEGDVVAVRHVNFRSHGYGHDYCRPTVPERWLRESGFADMVPFTAEDPPVCEAVGQTTFALQCRRRQKDLLEFERATGPRCVQDAAEIFAALGVRRRGIDEPELIGWLQRTLELGSPLVWDVARAWVEGGFLEALTYRHWKKRTYFPRRPRPVIHSLDGGRTIRATVVGLLPILSRRQAEEAASARGLTFGYREQACPWTPAPLVIEADDIDSFGDYFSAAGLGQPDLLPSPDQCVVSIDAVTGTFAERPLGYERVGTWDWAARAFVDRDEQSDVQLDRLGRPDAPDVYVVSHAGQPIWVGWSRTWAFLLAAAKRRVPLVERHEDGTVRVAAAGVRLPVSLGRWSVAVSGVCPGPVSSGECYSYDFAASDHAVPIERLLGSGATAPQWGERARWVATMATAWARNRADFVRLSSRTRSLLRECSAVEGLDSLARLTAAPKPLLPHVLALVREIEHSR